MNRITKALIFILLYLMITNATAYLNSTLPYKEIGQGIAKFDISKPIDVTGFTLKGYHLEGGKASIHALGHQFTPFLSFERGSIQIPTSMNLEKAPYIKTQVNYSAIKIKKNTLFIKAGIADRIQEVSNLDPSILKDGTYHWRVPFFAFGILHPQTNTKIEIRQFTQIGGIERSNAMYTKDIAIISHGKLIQTLADRRNNFVSPSNIITRFWGDYYGYGSVNWKAFGDAGAVSHDQGGAIEGKSTSISAIPNLSLIKGFIKLPTLQTYWSAPKNEMGNCPNTLKGCILATIASSISYKAIEISAPLFLGIKIFGESGMGLRELIPHNLRMDRNVNVYIKKLLPPNLNLRKNYASGNYKAPFFAFGIKIPLNKVISFIMEYAYFPLNENANRLSWKDAPNAKMYFYGFQVKRKIKIKNKDSYSL